MRAVLDTNILLSALIFSRGAPEIIYRAWRAAKFDLITSTAPLDELRRASRYPKLKSILPPHRVGAMVNNMHRAVMLEHLPNLPDNVKLNDQNDAFLYAITLAGEANYLVTGNW